MRLLKSPIDSTCIESFFSYAEDPHANFQVHAVGALNEVSDGVLSFSLDNPGIPEHACFLIGPESSEISKHTYRTTDPRLNFIKALSAVIQQVGLEDIQTENIDESAIIGRHTVLGKGVQIGEGTTIGNNVVIGDFVSIGKYCDIKSGAVIGENGFGFMRDESGIPTRFPHIGTVSIGDYVEVGSFSTVNKGALSTTTIHDHVKIDDHVHIGHNVVVNKGSLVTAGAIVGGSVTIGSECWIGLNSTIYQKVRIGNRSLLSIGADVLKDVPEDTNMIGNPARRIVFPNSKGQENN